MDSLKNSLQPLQEDLGGRVRHKEKWLRHGLVILPNVIAFDKDLSINAKALLLAFCAHAFLDSKFGVYEERECFVSHELLQEELGVSRGWISKYTRELEEYPTKENAVLEVERTGRSSNYTINLGAVNNKVDEVVKRIKKVREKKF